ncbi:receptor expression-enhancing protein 4 isoform X1 [Neopsephotus bourkii]|uniref:receptor expression-enhancing protein 4 isoform X1 n=1 Tax=Neopsephotus bourkii TaxID=309878 RepID=UPI002AA50C53|nr:receptor expression-enhancing protein 4 isoform X1 [Neopsephotus bourkii]XP_061205776.1 receptor expression-enhancing protein 4 isoform X1 [Neopsephotus bourkii]
MVSWVLSRLIELLFGMLYPAYASYKAVKTKNIREYVRWMMYWIVFALFMATETFTDLLISWFPFYYEVKMAFVIWLLSPYTRGASLLYRSVVHPTLSRKEKDIDGYILRARERGYETLVRFGKRGLNLAATAAVQAAAKSQGALAGRLRSFSMQDLRSGPEDTPVHCQHPLYLEEPQSHRQLLGEPGAGITGVGAQAEPIAGLCWELSCAPPHTLSPANSGTPGPWHYESDTEEEEEEKIWSDLEAASSQQEPRALSRSQSLRVAKKKAPSKEGSSRLLRSRTRKQTAPWDQDD